MISKHKTIIRVIWAIVLTAFILLTGLLYSIKYNTFNLFGGLPSLSSLEKPDSNLSSELISSDDKSLGKYYRHNRSEINFEELSPELVETLLVTEDIRFDDHAGIDLRGLARAVFGVVTGNFKGGGSTITMQLAENLYGTSTENQGILYKYKRIGQIITKLKEWIIAIQLEQSYTKKEILALYLNTIEYGANSYGIKVASQTFFHKTPKELNHKESAILVALINAPTRYNPVRNPEKAKNKRREILYNLYKYNKIDKTSFDSLKNSNFGLKYKVDNQNQGLATYFRSFIKRDLIKWCKKNNYDLFADGLKIYTTIDSRMQNYAEQAMISHMTKLQEIFNDHLKGDNPWIDDDGEEIKDFIENTIKRTVNYKKLSNKYGDNVDTIMYYLEQPKKMKVFSWQGEIDTVMSLVDSLKYYKHFLQAGFMAMDPHSGHIKAWVGGINHKYFKYDHVKQGRRQPGSTFKPFIYAAAINNGYSPCLEMSDVPVTWVLPDETTWSPNNSNGRFSGENMTIRRAMASSVNSITAMIMQLITPQSAVEMAYTCGIESELQAVPALCLGAGGDVSLFELVGAYSTFVNKGLWTKPFYIDRIEDKNGVIIQEFKPTPSERLSEKTAYLMIHMLKGSTEERGGTGMSIKKELRIDNEIGAKTGTTQSASDGWFMGITKGLVAGAWVGGDDRSIHFKHWYLGQGARTAMPIWQEFMTQVYADSTLMIQKGPFPEPEEPIDVELDCNTYSLYTSSSDSIQDYNYEDFNGY